MEKKIFSEEEIAYFKELYGEFPSAGQDIKGDDSNTSSDTDNDMDRGIDIDPEEQDFKRDLMDRYQDLCGGLPK